MRKPDTGAALVLAIGIIAILLAIGFTFYFVTRGELYTAELSLRQAQADQLLRGAINIGISVLNKDINQNPYASSTDHAWRSFFSGAWVAGKPWALRNSGAGRGYFALRSSMQWKGSIPHIDIARLWINFPNLQGFMLNLPPEQRFLYVRFADGYSEMLYNGPRSREWLFYPRIEGFNAPILYDLNAELIVPGPNPSLWVPVPQKVGSNFLYYRFNVSADTFDEITREGDIPRSSAPFLLPSMFGTVRNPDGTPVFTGFDRYGNSYATSSLYTPEWVNAWADVDLDGDGYKDAVWMPMAADKLFSGVVKDSAGEIHQNLNDGLDNNLNGLVDETPDNGVNEEMGPFFLQNEPLPQNDLPDKYGDETADPEEVFEVGAFVYWGGDDGLDNNCDGIVDDSAEQKVFLTAPLPGLRMKVDWNADGIIDRNDMVPDENGNMVYLEVIMPSSIEVVRYTPTGQERYNLTADDVDCLDNDYDMLVNNFESYAYIGPNNIENFFTITENNNGEIQTIQLPGPPFVLKGFVSSGPYQGVPMYDRTKRNQKDLQNYDYTFAKFAMPGNWNPDDKSNFSAAREASYIEINHFLDSGGNPFLPGVQVYPSRGIYRDGVAGITRPINYTRLIPYIHITHTGEPVCDLMGRMAVYITDESKKVNLNIAGGHYPIDFNFAAPNPLLAGKMLRTYFIPGISSPWLIGYGLETRFLPDMGIIRARKLWNLLTGAPGGQIDSSQSNYILNASSSSLYYDVAFPGYGVVDDNANAFLLLTNGLDDDGDGVVDNGVNDLLGILEGIDEPGEFQYTLPYANKLAERDRVDNNANNNMDESGELGDRTISTPDQINELSDYGIPGTTAFEKIKPTITTMGLSKNTQIRKFGTSLRGINPVNVNYATPEQLASTILLSEKPVSSINTMSWRMPMAEDAYYFAEGLRSYEYEWDTWFGDNKGEVGFLFYSDDGTNEPISAFNPTINYIFPVDAVLKTMQLAVNLTDMRDSDVAQSRLTTEKVPDPLTSTEKNIYNPSQNINSLSPYEKGYNTSNFPLRNIENYAKNTLGELDINWAINDYWWSERVLNGVNNNGIPVKDLRSISYTVAGVDSIRITELMVRPVRRVEAEIPVYQNLYNSYKTPYPPGIPLFLTDFEPLSNRFLDDENHDVVPQNPWNLANNNVLGKGNYYETNLPVFQYIDRTNIPPLTTDIPNVVEYRIRATNSLPAGRYYLTLNTQNLLGEPTLNRASNKRIKYAIKYCPINVNNPSDTTDDTLIEPSILDDVYANPLIVANDAVFQRVQDSWIGVNARGETTGMVFLPGQLESETLNPPAYYWMDGILPEEQPIYGKTFAVTVPPYTPADGQDNDYVLCIAFWLEQTSNNEPISLNFLDFSQEPDHEYIEIANISDNPIDLTGYTLEIGIPRDKSGTRTDPYKVTAKIGDENNVNNRYIIAPKGRLLLTFDSSSDLIGDKFDHYRDPNITPASLIKRNGIGLCDVIPTVPVPPELEPLVGITTPFIALNETNNVFRREYTNNGLEEDFTDYNGDGTPGDNPADNDIRSTPNDNNFNIVGPRKAWDRIVPLYSVEFPLIDGENTERRKTEQITTLNDLAKLVLQGGILPDYPEHDGYDNDGDGGYLTATGKYELGTLEKDGVDNNLNGVIDDRATDLSNPLNILFSEGVDEGRVEPGTTYTNGRLFGYGSYEKGMLPVFHLKDMATYGGNIDVDFISDPYDQVQPVNVTTGFNYIGNPNLIEPYFGTDNDPPQWKYFVERRWNPGDCVVVILYDTSGNQVDGVSYNENDVINRCIDDILPAPNSNMQLNPDFSSWWIPDCMLWDFYRSLNRKSPELSGDRFGLSNRWEATDGFYDDWEESPHYLEQLTLVMLDNTPPNNFPLFQYTNNNPYRDKRDINFVVNTYRGTPLGKSYTEIALAGKDFSSPIVSLPDSPIINGRNITLLYPYWNTEQRRDVGTIYAGTLGQLKIPIQREYLYSLYRMKQVFTNPEYRYLFDLNRQNLTLYPTVGGETFWRQVWTSANVLASQLQGKDEVNRVLKGASSMITTAEKILTVGTADFIPIRPNPAETDVFPSGSNLADMLRFDLTSNTYPEAWVPLFLFMLPGEVYTYPKFVDGSLWGGTFPTPYNTLFNAQPNGSWLFNNNTAFGRPQMDINDIAQRWEIPKRIFAYVSSYRTTYPEQNRPEALFVWDVNDGIENGDYYVYINVVSEKQLKRLQFYDEQLHASGTPPYELFSQEFGELWINKDYDPTQVKLALEIITDPAKARGLKPRGSTLETGLTHPDDWYRTEVGGFYEDVVDFSPNKDGIILYGQQAAASWQSQMVRVTQKFVALRVRNTGDAPCFLTHITLVPAKSSLHKININTIEPYIYTDGRQRRVFASSMCLPGFYYRSDILPKNQDLNNPLYSVNPIPSANANYYDNVSDTVLSAFQLSNLLIENRPEYTDGRYYLSPLELANTIRSKYLLPLSVNTNYSGRIADVLSRYESIADHISLRSDVFKITTLVQLGSGVDGNKDGCYSYRTNDEFVVQSEARASVIYERSVPAARYEED
ncbi:MAG TPA: hypothetical protein PLA12_05030 [Candidatus Hydrogenedens sp.]|nr:hypothetical protein [Candidatus Hydrogenedens sp.]